MLSSAFRSMILICSMMVPALAESGPELVDRLVGLELGAAREAARQAELSPPALDAAVDHLVRRLLRPEATDVENAIDLQTVAGFLGKRGPVRRGLLRHRGEILAACGRPLPETGAMDRQTLAIIQGAFSLLKLLPEEETAAIEQLILESVPRVASGQGGLFLGMGISQLLQDQRPWSDDFRQRMRGQLLSSESVQVVSMIYPIWQMLVLRGSFDVELFVTIHTRFADEPLYRQVVDTVMGEIEAADVDDRLVAVIERELAREDHDARERVALGLLLHAHRPEEATTAIRSAMADPDLSDYWRKALLHDLEQAGLAQLAPAVPVAAEVAATVPAAASEVAAAPELEPAPEPGSVEHPLARMMETGTSISEDDLAIADAVPDEQVDELVDRLLARCPIPPVDGLTALDVVASSSWLEELGFRRERFARSLDRHAAEWRAELARPVDTDDSDSRQRHRRYALQHALSMLGAVATLDPERDQQLLQRWIEGPHAGWLERDGYRFARRLAPWSKDFQESWLRLIEQVDPRRDGGLRDQVKTYLRVVRLDPLRSTRLVDALEASGHLDGLADEVFAAIHEDHAFPFPEQIDRYLAIAAEAGSVMGAVLLAVAEHDPERAVAATLERLQVEGIRSHQVDALLWVLHDLPGEHQAEGGIAAIAAASGHADRLQRVIRERSSGEGLPWRHHSPRTRAWRHWTQNRVTEE
jgi:hypothetical protein